MKPAFKILGALGAFAATLFVEQMAIAQPLGLTAEHDYVCSIQAGQTSLVVSDTVYLTLFQQPETHDGHRTPARKEFFLRTQPDFNIGIRIPQSRPDTPLEAFLRPHTGWGGSTYGDNFKIGLSLDIRLSTDIPGATPPSQPYDLSDFNGFQGRESGVTGNLLVKKTQVGFDVSFSYLVDGKLDFKMVGSCQ